MKFELNDYKKELTDEEIIEDIKRMAKELGHDYISISTYKKFGKYSQTAIQGHFGTWQNALSIAGLRIERSPSELKFISDKEYYDDFIRVAKIIAKNTVTYEEYKQHGHYAVTYVFKRFGDWDSVLVGAGLEPTGLARKKIDKKTLFDEIERLWLLLGRQPTSTDITKGNMSKYSIDTFKRRFGGWRKALEAFVEYIGEDDSADSETCIEEVIGHVEIEAEQTVTDSYVKPKHMTSRNINTRLRFKTLQRDNFKCCACGASPAKDPSVELHVDHIVPWSKGGETVINNLQTLCSKCNLGKGDMG